MLKIILADNQAIFRAGAAKVLAVEDDMRIVAQADTLQKLHMALSSFRAGVLIFSETLAPDSEPAPVALSLCEIAGDRNQSMKVQLSF